jgi:GT2 family glycosyltransferase
MPHNPTDAAPAPVRPTFSFLTTAYRSEDTLSRTIDSVLAQSRSDWELVVVDNGMSEAIVAVVEPHLDDSRVRLVRQENRGANGGVQAAAAAATGRFMVVLNSDDTIAAEYCATVGAFLDANPGVGAVTCDAVQFTDPGMRPLPGSYLRAAGLRSPADPGRRLRLADLVEGPCPYYTTAVRADVWSALGGMGGPECETPVVHDLDFWLRLVGAGHDLRMIPDRLGFYRIEQGSESRPQDPARVEVFEQQREQALTRAVLRSGTDEDVAALHRVVVRLRYGQAIRRGRASFVEGDAEAARRYLREAFRLRKTLRAGAVLSVLTVAPGLLGRVHPVKRRLQARLRPRTPA